MSDRHELVVWDFDGTLADTRSAIIDAATHALTTAGHPAPRPEQVTALVGLPIAELYRSLAGDPGDETIAWLVGAHRSHFLANAAALTTLFPGVSDLLGDVAAGGARNAVATSRTRRTLLPLMDHLGITGHFAALRTDDTVSNPKPAPDMVVELCAELGVPTNRTTVVGDTAFDVGMGNRAGSTTCGVTWGNHGRVELEAAGADHVVDTMDELRSLLGAAVT